MILRRVLLITLTACTLSLMLGVKPSAALEEMKVYRGVLVLEGKIVPGDYDKLRSFLGKKSNFDKISGGVFLASPGGSITQAMKIGRLIRDLQLSTDAPSGPPTGSPKFGQSVITPSNLVNPSANYVCASACFFVYVGGVYRNLSWVGRLGLHRPFQLESSAKKLDVDQTLNLTWQVREAVKKYLEDMDVPDKYVDVIYSTPSNQLRWLTQSEFDSDFWGFIPEIKKLMATKCGLQNAGQSDETIKCWMQIRTGLMDEAWNKVFSPSNGPRG